MMRMWAAAMLAAFGTMSCADEPAAEVRAKCTLDKAIEVIRSEAVRFDAIAVAPYQDGAVAAWSDPTGTYTRLLDRQGKPRSPSTRISERCRGGLDLTDHQGRLALACSRPSEREDNAPLVLLQLKGHTPVESETILGQVGRDGSGVSLASDGQRMLVAYHDGTIGAYAARLVIIDENVPSSRLLSDLSFAAGVPQLVARQGHWVVAFSETESAPEKTHTRIILVSDTQPARAVADTLFVDPSPAPIWNEAGLWLSYRDRTAKNPKPDLYTVRLSENLSFVGTKSQIGRANSEGEPSVMSCRGLSVALLPREYATERYIGVHGLDPALGNLGAGHQYYSNSRDFVLASAACVGASALVITAERKPPAEPGASIMALPFSCAL